MAAFGCCSYVPYILERMIFHANPSYCLKTMKFTTVEWNAYNRKIPTRCLYPFLLLYLRTTSEILGNITSMSMSLRAVASKLFWNVTQFCWWFCLQIPITIFNPIRKQTVYYIIRLKILNLEEIFLGCHRVAVRKDYWQLRL